MIQPRLLSFFFLLLCGMLFSEAVGAPKEYDEKKIEVAMRMIGHQFLQKIGDSTSRVLPVTKSNEQYKITFENEFAFEPDQLIESINAVMKETNIASAYIVEVQQCEKDVAVYSYNIANAKEMDLIPCRGRGYEKGCYAILISLKELEITYPMQHKLAENALVKNDASGNKIYYALGALSLLLVGVIVFIKKRKEVKANSVEEETEKPDDPNLIKIGAYQFDKRNATLSINGERTELSGKEADLLLLLHENLNETIERDEILNKVWGDEGDYVGRTLDVFISKLRKKLDGDAAIKIMNIRGVGYRLVVG